MSARNIFLGSVCGLFLMASSAYAVGPTQEELNNAENDGANWLYADHDYRGHRYSPLDQINTKNAANLSQVCSYSFPEKMPAQTAPIVYNGVIFATTAHYTVALDGASCKPIWTYQWKPRAHETFVTQRGAAIKDGKIVRGTPDGYLIALDAKTGKEAWVRQAVDSAGGYFFSMPPLIYDDLVLIGPAGSEFASKGWVGAFKLSDGEPVWKFNNVPDPGEPGAETWGPDPSVLKHGGGNLWTPMSLDVEKGWLYVPVGNPAPDFFDRHRPGDNLYTGSVVALDVHTGKLAWYYQAVPHDVRDYDLSHASPVFKTVIDGQTHTILALNGKDGLLRGLDRDTHKVLYSAPFTTRENAEGDLKPELGRVCPGLLGGHEWNGGAYSPRLHALFMPATDWCNHIVPDTQAPSTKDQNKKGQFFGGKFEFEPWDKAGGWVGAFNDANGKKLWAYESAKPVISSVAATGGDLVFVGELTGDFLAFDATDGKLLFKHDLGGPAAGGVVSYAVDGKQYVGVVSGFVGGYYHQLAPAIEGGNPTINVFALKP